jgi:hypothetical protein
MKPNIIISHSILGFSAYQNGLGKPQFLTILFEHKPKNMKGLVSLILIFLIYGIAILISVVNRWLRRADKPATVEEDTATKIRVPPNFSIPPSPPKAKYPAGIKWPLHQDGKKDR